MTRGPQWSSSRLLLVGSLTDWGSHRHFSTACCSDSYGHTRPCRDNRMSLSGLSTINSTKEISSLSDDMKKIKTQICYPGQNHELICLCSCLKYPSPSSVCVCVNVPIGWVGGHACKYVMDVYVETKCWSQVSSPLALCLASKFKASLCVHLIIEITNMLSFYMRTGDLNVGPHFCKRLLTDLYTQTSVFLINIKTLVNHRQAPRWSHRLTLDNM